MTVDDARPHNGRGGRRFRRRTKVVSAILGALLSGGFAFAAASWVVGLSSGSNGEAQSASVSDLTITAVASPAPNNVLYPGGDGDVVLTISNPNAFPVTISSVSLPSDTTYATGYSNSALTSAQSGCTATTSDVTWSYSTSTSGSTHDLTTALVVGGTSQADDPLTVTFTDDASMSTSAPAACEGTYFSMPSLTAVGATAGGTPTTSPATDGWTS